MILYFSAMGNSQFVAKKTAHFLNEETICLNQRIKNANYDPIYSENLISLFVLSMHGEFLKL